MATLEMSPADIEQAIKSIAEKKDDLRKTFEILQSYSSSIGSVNLQWKDIDDHVSSIEKSISERFRKTKNSGSSSVVESTAAALPTLKVEEKHDEQIVQPLPNLKTICFEMDGKGLISFISNNRKDIILIRRELGSALLCAPDPVTLVIDSLDSFIQSNMTSNKRLYASIRSCTSILECLKGLSLEIKPQARDRARELAVKWKEIKDNKEDEVVVVLSYLFLIATFGLLESFDDSYILDLIIMVGWTESMFNLCRNCKLEEKIPDLVNRFISIKRHLVAVNFVLAFNLQDKFPPAPLLEAHVNYSKKYGERMRHRGKEYISFKRNAYTKEIADLKAAIKIVEEYKLESVYPCEDLRKCIRELEEEKIEMHQERVRVPAPNSSNSNSKSPKKPHQKPNKRPRPSTSAAPDQLAKKNHSQLYNHGGNSILPANYAGVGSLHAPPMPHFLPLDPPAGPTYFDMIAMNAGYRPGLPAQFPFNPSPFP